MFVWTDENDRDKITLIIHLPSNSEDCIIASVVHDSLGHFVKLILN